MQPANVSPPLILSAQTARVTTTVKKASWQFWLVGGVIAVAVVILLAGALGLIPLFPQPVSPSDHGWGGPFTVGNARLSKCPQGDKFRTSGCSGGDYLYNLTFESSQIEFDQILFHVERPNGSLLIVFSVQAGFTIFNQSGVLSADYPTPGGSMSMYSGWVYFDDIQSTTTLNNLYSLWVDIGTSNPTGQGYQLTYTGTAGFDGTGSSALP